MRILVADDNDECRNLLRDMFVSEPNIELAMAHDGAEAWWLLTEPSRRFDLGIFDLNMPKVNGLKLIERIRGSATLARLPIILCTGVSDRDTVGRAARLAITHYVVKPFKPDSMREKIRSCTPRRPGGAKIPVG